MDVMDVRDKKCEARNVKRETRSEKHEGRTGERVKFLPLVATGGSDVSS